MYKRQLIASALSASLLVAALPGLASAQDGEPYAAENMEWLLSSYAQDGATVEVPEGVEATLLLSGSQAAGSAGCNNYFGAYEIDAESLTFPEPFGTTRMLCQDPSQVVEDAYLPLLSATAGWVVQDGMLNLSDGEGVTTLVFAEPPVPVTASDIAALTSELESLQAQIDEASAEVAALTEAAESVNVKKITNRVSANEESIAALEQKTKGLNVENFKNRLKTAEAAIVELDKQLTNVKNRVKDLEAIAKDHEERLSAIEEQVPVPEPQ